MGSFKTLDGSLLLVIGFPKTVEETLEPARVCHSKSSDLDCGFLVLLTYTSRASELCPLHVLDTPWARKL
jgi:hypothetical protein